MFQQENTAISIARDGGLYLASERLDLTQLAARLKELGAQQPVTIRADSNTDYKRLVEVMDACKAADVSRISLATATAR
jgi:biopolymer transport protein ExbD